MTDPEHDEAVILSYGRALSSLLSLISGLATAGVLVYLLGWLRSSGYYGSFKSEWILPSLSFTEVASRGIYPILALFFALFLSFTDIAKRRFEIEQLAKVMLVTAAMWFLALVATYVLPKFGYHTHAVKFAAVAVIASASFAMTQFGEIVLELNSNVFKWRSKHILTMSWALVVFGAMTFYLGSMEGERDNREASSILPVVTLDDRSIDIWRLLAAQGELSYLVKLSPELPSIKIIKAEHLTIAPDVKTLQKNVQHQEHSSHNDLQLNAQATTEEIGRFPYLTPLTNLSCCYSWIESSRQCPYPFSRLQ